MKKGLRRAAARPSGQCPFKRGPDEEGIETPLASRYAAATSSNADLMKKGLRLFAWQPFAVESVETRT